MKYIPAILYHLFLLILLNDNVKSTALVPDCPDLNYFLLATIDGTITALDLNTGKKCWSVLLNSEKFFDSTLSGLEFYEKDEKVWLVPSLDGSLFKYYYLKKVIQPVPLNVDSLIHQSVYMNSYTNVVGSKEKNIFGVDRLTGEIAYYCKRNGCKTLKHPLPENLLVIEEKVQYASTLDTKVGENIWHFRVSELKILLTSPVSYDYFVHIAPFHPNNGAKSSNVDMTNALIPKTVEIINIDAYKLSLQNGFAGKMNRTNGFSWIFKASCPITEGWVLKDNILKTLDPFERESGFFSIERDDGKISALLFLGTYGSQMFIKKSKDFYNEDPYHFPLSTNEFYNSILHPVCPGIPSPNAVDNVMSNSTDIMIQTMNFNASDYGSYFYLNYSVAENKTHCILNGSYIQSREAFYKMSKKYLFYWAVAYYVFVPVFILLLCYVKHAFKAKEHLYITVNSIETTSAPTQYRSRFDQDFEYLSTLGRGGFGVVMDAKNKIDDCRYAVKRIRLNGQSNQLQHERVLREVKALAKLDHKGIVRYFNAWTEFPPLGFQERKDEEYGIRDCESHSSSLCSDQNDSSHFTASKTSAIKKDILVPKKTEKTHSILRKKLNHNPLAQFEDDFNCDFSLSSNTHHEWEDSSSSSESEHTSYNREASLASDDGNIDYISTPNLSGKTKTLVDITEQEDLSDGYTSDNDVPNSVSSYTRGYLYIQMQLCKKESLRDWLDHNTRREYDNIMEMFSQIVDAVHYVHECGLMHRDLKPSNIYFSLEGNIKIGDFGLATSIQMDDENPCDYQLEQTHTTDIGTAIYMSPEQKAYDDYNFKTDIYSLGIILFELFVPFQTRSEQYQAILNLRHHQFPKDFEEQYPKERALMKRMLDEDPEDRPDSLAVIQTLQALKHCR